MTAPHRRSLVLTCLIAAFAVTTVSIVTVWILAVVYDAYFYEKRLYIDRGDPTGAKGVFIGDGAFHVTQIDRSEDGGIVTAAFGDGQVYLASVYGVWSAPADAASSSAVEKAYDESAEPIFRDGTAVGLLHAPWDASKPIRAATLDGATLWETPTNAFGTQRAISASPAEILLGDKKAVVLAQRFITFERGNIVQETASTLTRGLVDSGFESEYVFRLSAIDETGAPLWERDVAGGNAAMWPSEDGAEIIYGPDTSDLTRFNAHTGESLGPFPIAMEGAWRVRPVTWPAPEGGARTLLVLFGGGVALYDPAESATRWHLDLVSASYGLCAATAVRFRHDEEPSIAVFHSPPSVSSPYYQLWIVDANGAIRYHEAGHADVSNLIAVPQADGSESLWLVGGVIKRFDAI